MGLIKKVESIKKKDAAAKGLLNKCLARQNQEEGKSIGSTQETKTEEEQGEQPQAPAGEPCKPGVAGNNKIENQLHTLGEKAFIENIQERVNGITGGIESPAYLFRFLYEYFNFRHGAFFFIDTYHQVFSPLAAINWSKNITEKIMIPVGVCQELFEEFVPEPEALKEDSLFPGSSQETEFLELIDTSIHSFITFSLLESKKLSPYRSLFAGTGLLDETVGSVNFIDPRSELVIKPFFLDNALVAFLIISGMEQAYVNLLDKILVPVALKLIRDRQEALKTTFGHMPLAMPRQIPPEVVKKEQAHGKTIKVSYDLLLTTVLAENNLLYPFTVKQDILLILGNLFATLGQVYKSPEENALYLKLYNKDEIDELLLIHQCYATLHTFFKVTKSMLLIQTNDFIPSQQTMSMLNDD